MKILYLYAELSPYLRPVFDIYVKQYGVELHVVHWDHIKLTPYKPAPIDGVFYYNRSEFDLIKLVDLAEGVSPDLVYVVGWMDMDYLRVSKMWRKRGIPVVSGFDDIWRGSTRQRFGSLLIKLFGQLFFSHAFVSFSRQYEYAKRIGFKDENIVHNLLSCDTSIFNGTASKLPDKGVDYPHTFLYVGRFSPEKGIDLLVNAFNLYRNDFGGSWKLLCVGNGDLRCLLDGVDNLEVMDFVDPIRLASIYDKAGAFVLPSYSDVSPLAVHEAATACLPLILSSGVGNKSTFLIDGFNGFSFNSSSVRGLADAMQKVSDLSDTELMAMSERSCCLSKRVNPEIVAASLMSILLNTQ